MLGNKKDVLQKELRLFHGTCCYLCSTINWTAPHLSCSLEAAGRWRIISANTEERNQSLVRYLQLWCTHTEAVKTVETTALFPDHFLRVFHQFSADGENVILHDNKEGKGCRRQWLWLEQRQDSLSDILTYFKCLATLKLITKWKQQMKTENSVSH